MSDNKTEKMAEFYRLCVEKGYIDMSDEKQSLKAKVIATDLNLKYGKIDKFYEKARLCHEQLLNEQKAYEEAENVRIAKENTPGQLVVSFDFKQSNQKSTNKLDLYRRKDGSYYYERVKGLNLSTYNNIKFEKHEGKPNIDMKKNIIESFKYNPPQTVFTSASSGGVSMGGFHQIDGTMSASLKQTDNGTIKVDGNVVFRIVLPDFLKDRFKRDESFKKYVEEDNIIYCMRNVGGVFTDICKRGVVSRANAYAFTTISELAFNENCIPFSDCQKIFKLVNKIIDFDYPPSDEEYYRMATDLLYKSTTVDKIEKAIKTFEIISDYKDAADKLIEAKEVAILKKESNRKKRNKILVISIASVLFAMIIIVTTVNITSYISNKKAAEKEAANKVKYSNYFTDTMYYHILDDGEIESAIFFEAAEGKAIKFDKYNVDDNTWKSVDEITWSYIQALETKANINIGNGSYSLSVIDGKPTLKANDSQTTYVYMTEDKFNSHIEKYILEKNAKKLDDKYKEVVNIFSKLFGSKNGKEYGEVIAMVFSYINNLDSSTSVNYFDENKNEFEIVTDNDLNDMLLGKWIVRWRTKSMEYEFLDDGTYLTNGRYPKEGSISEMYWKIDNGLITANVENPNFKKFHKYEVRCVLETVIDGTAVVRVYAFYNVSTDSNNGKLSFVCVKK